MLRRIGLVVCTVALSAGASRAASDTPTQTPVALTWRSDTSTFIRARESLWTEHALTWAGAEGIARDGLRLRAHVAANLWGRVGGRRTGFVETGLVGAAVGVRQQVDAVSVTGFAGIEHVYREGDVIDRRTGPFGILQLVWSPMPDSFASLYLAGSTARRDLGLTLTTGIATPFGFNIGPEAGLAFDRDGHTMRVGLAVTGIAARIGTVSLSAGALRDSVTGAGFYWGAHIERRF